MHAINLCKGMLWRRYCPWVSSTTEGSCLAGVSRGSQVQEESSSQGRLYAAKGLFCCFVGTSEMPCVCYLELSQISMF